MLEQIAKRIRTQIYDSVWIDEEEDVYLEKTNGIVERRINEYLKYLVDEGYIRWLKTR